MRNGSKQFYETSDLTLAAYLYAKGIILVDIDRSNPKRANFIFKHPQDELIAEFQSGEATIKVFAYANAIDELKARLYNGQANGNK